MFVQLPFSLLQQGFFKMRTRPCPSALCPPNRTMKQCSNCEAVPYICNLLCSPKGPKWSSNLFHRQICKGGQNMLHLACSDMMLKAHKMHRNMVLDLDMRFGKLDIIVKQ
ncbi:hypothetical protein M758_12G158800 [Ceratodon purpureus]|uniref:Uncharacterized protein n=1 Tax=Ceratodon purpureus TaxID=3225 RepID=A0A8T0G914_CERPU|nr:hypothetical protein KC19_12G156300 [Ceratodon purpureus]KAG0599526.1 hypothetical protein M758_12G158800 [Ceratodon purpureus]